MGSVKRHCFILFGVMAAALALAGCALSSKPEIAPTLVVPTVVSAITAEPESARPGSDAEAPPPPTLAPTSLPQPATSTPPATITPEPEGGEPLFRVALVEADDVLNVRAVAGVENEIVGELQPEATGILITGPGTVVDGSVWVPIESGRVRGWVNSLFLTPDAKEESACERAEVVQLLADFTVALEQEDDNALANLIHPERGLHLHVSWWNPDVWLLREATRALFSDDTEYEWGFEDGSGLPIEGSFREVLLPLLQEDLLGASEEACNEILAGATAGIVTLPEGFAPYNYISYYRPAADESGFAWGSWVVGFEEWDGNWYLSFLVHFAWEI